MLSLLWLKRNNFSVLISNLYNDFNISTVIRNCNAFLAKEVIVYGSKQWDRRGAVGTHNYQHLKYIKDLSELNDSYIIGVDNLPGSVAIETFDWPKDKHIVIAFGQEQVGLPQEILDICKSLVYIRQYGSVRSLNVGCASSIAMYDYCRKAIKWENTF